MLKRQHFRKHDKIYNLGHAPFITISHSCYHLGSGVAAQPTGLAGSGMTAPFTYRSAYHLTCRGAPRPSISHGDEQVDRKQVMRLWGDRQGRAWTAVCRAQDGTNAGSVALSQYLGKGPYAVSPSIQLRFLVRQGRSGPLDCNVNVFLPKVSGDQHSGPQGWPLLVLSAGFLLHSSMYGSYAADLASWGLAVVLYDLPELVDDVTMVSALGSILDACTSDPRVKPYVDQRAVLLAGHSRGGKLSVLAAARDPRVKGIALLDPVDVTSMTPVGPGYPSALPAMRLACGPPRSIPTLIVGAACNTGVVPADANYRRFLASCPGPCWFLELSGAGHLQFLDAKVDLLSAFVESGPTPDEAVRRVSKVATLAWALELAVPLARGEALNGRQVMERLQQISAVLERQARLSWSLNGFDAVAVRAPPGSAPGASSSSSSGNSSSRSTAASFGQNGTSARMTDGAKGAEMGTGSEQIPRPSLSSMPGGSTVGGDSRNGDQEKHLSYEELMRMRARELKTILVERGVDCSDCFEKADLAKRIIDRC